MKKKHFERNALISIVIFAILFVVLALQTG